MRYKRRMKRAGGWLALLAIGAGLTVFAYEMDDIRAAETTARQTDDANRGAAEYLAAKKEEFGRWVSARLDDLDRKQAEMKVRADALGDRAKAEWQEFGKTVAEERANIGRNLEQARQEGAEQWDKVKSRTESAVEALQSKYDSLVARLKKEG
jgi:hypothetical protein